MIKIILGALILIACASHCRDQRKYSESNDQLALSKSLGPDRFFNISKKIPEKIDGLKVLKSSKDYFLAERVSLGSSNTSYLLELKLGEDLQSININVKDYIHPHKDYEFSKKMVGWVKDELRALL